MAVFNCPQCGHAQAVEDKYTGRSATCPKCKTQGVVQQGSSTGSLPIPEPAGDADQRVIHEVAGPLGIRCDAWMDSQRHINKASSLQIDWWTVVDDSLPVRFAQPCGLVVHNRANDYPLLLAYHADTVVQVCDEPVMAFEVRYLAFNVWAEHVATVVAEEIADLKPGKKLRWNHNWDIASETEGTSHCASLGFVYRLRLANGKILTANLEFVLREAQRFMEKFTEADLEPTASKKQS